MKSGKKSLIGAHTSIAGGVSNALIEGQKIGATTIQIFTANQRRWDSKPLTSEAVDQWQYHLKETGIQQVMSHASYLINLGSSNPDSLQKSRQAFLGEVERCIELELSYLNFHPGSAGEQSVEQCMDRICESVLLTEKLVNSSSLRLIFENTAGQGKSIGRTFEELAYMLNKVEKQVPVGVCLDTCHLFVSGYDIRTVEGWKSVLKEFDKIVGLQHLYAFHMNDSMKPLASYVDRHQSLGKGLIGIDCFKFLMQDPRTKDIPKYLETPDPELWPEEIALLREFRNNAPQSH